MKVIFVRQGESTGNAGVPSFDLSKLELTQAGHDQAAAVAASWDDRPDLIVRFQAEPRKIPKLK